MNIKIIINGEEKLIEEGKNILTLLEEYKLPEAMVAVELNGNIINKLSFSAVKIKKGDKIEIVKMMGGG